MLLYLDYKLLQHKYPIYWCKSTKKSPFLRTFAKVFNSMCEMEDLYAYMRILATLQSVAKFSYTAK